MSNKPLPVKGYTEQSNDKIDLVNTNKVLEEHMLRRIDELSELARSEPKLVDARMLALARTNIEQGCMWLNRAIFQPKRIDISDNQ